MIELMRRPDGGLSAVRIDQESYQAWMDYCTPGKGSAEGQRVEEAVKKAVQGAGVRPGDHVFIIPAPK